MIASRSNALVKKARSLRERRGRLDHGLFAIEGVRLVEDALDGGYQPALVLYDAPQLQTTERGARLLARLVALDAPGGAAAPEVLRDVCDTLHPAGVFAALPLPADRERPGLPPGRGLAVVLGEVQDPGNAGSIIRTAAAAGADGLIATTGTVDLYAPKVARAGMGSHLRLPLRVSQDWAALAPWLAARDQVVVADGRASRTLYQVDWRRDTALVLGNEARGHDEDALASAANTLRVTIPMPGGSESLNVAAAAAVLLYEAVRQRDALTWPGG